MITLLIVDLCLLLGCLNCILKGLQKVAEKLKGGIINGTKRINRRKTNARIGSR